VQHLDAYVEENEYLFLLEEPAKTIVNAGLMLAWSGRLFPFSGLRETLYLR
jgi:hypothetical protein